MYTETITITLNDSETLALAKIVFARMQALEALPRSKENLEEVQALGSFIAKMAPHVNAHAARERSQWN